MKPITLHTVALCALLAVSCSTGQKVTEPTEAQDPPTMSTSRTQAGGMRSGTAGVEVVRTGEVRLTFLGNAGREITDGRTVVLLDPYLSGTSRPEGVDPIRVPDAKKIDEHVLAADYVLVTHGHPDHALDAPCMSSRPR